MFAIHLLMGHADNVNRVVADKIEDQVAALWIAVIAFFHVRAMSPERGILGKPTETCFHLSKIGISLILTPARFRIFGYRKKIVPGARR